MTPPLQPTRGTDRPLILSDRQGFDRRWFAPNLQAVYVPNHIDQVAGCVDAALASYGKAVKIASGRHCYEDFVYNASTLAVIDLSALNQVGFDPVHDAWFVDAGAENWTVYRTLLNGYGKTLPAGSCYSVGAGGHITGGGYGFLSRLHGLTVDHLTGVDIVTWDGHQATLRHVSAESTDEGERDLFWALCGAGCGNFGVIARYYFASPPDAPDHATIWNLAWDWTNLDPARFARLLGEYGEQMASLPETEFTALALRHVAAKQITYTLQCVSLPGTTYSEHCRHAERRIAETKARFDKIVPSSPVRRPLYGRPGSVGTAPAAHDYQHLTYLEALQTLDGTGANRFGKYKSAYMRGAFPTQQVDAIYHWLNKQPDGDPAPDMSESLVQVDSYGGVVNTVAPATTAVPQRSSIMKLQYQTYWNNHSEPGRGGEPLFRQQGDAYLDWIDSFYRAVYAPYGGTPNPSRDTTGLVDGCYYNYPDSGLGTHERGDVDEALWLYFLDNYRNNPRNLVRVKQRWDPESFFHHAQSIPVR